jgi:ribose transport system permease protein
MSTVPVSQGSAGLSRRLIAGVPAVVLLVLILAVASQRPSFLSVTSLRTLLEGTAPLLLLALGQTFVILTGGIDLSQAVLASFGTVLLALWLPIGGPLGALAVLLALTLAGALNGLVCAYAQIPSFVVTLGTMGLWAGAALAVSGSSTISITKGYNTIFWLRDLRVAGLPVSAIMAIGAVLLAAVLMRALSRGATVPATPSAPRRCPAGARSGCGCSRSRCPGCAPGWPRWCWPRPSSAGHPHSPTRCSCRPSRPSWWAAR